MNAPQDDRHRHGDFLTAPAIFPNNDIKYEVNKTRAQIFARETQQAISWSIAKDKPSNKVIAEKLSPIYTVINHKGNIHQNINHKVQ